MQHLTVIWSQEGYRNIGAAAVKRAFYDYVSDIRRVYALTHPTENEATQHEYEAVLRLAKGRENHIDWVLKQTKKDIEGIEAFVNGRDFEMFSEVTPERFYEVAEIHLQKWLDGGKPVVHPLHYKD